MWPLLEQLLWTALLAAFGILVKIEEDTERDEALVHAMCKKVFGDIPLSECLDRIRAEPSHELRNVAKWWESPRRTKDTTATSYRRSEIALNRAIADATKDITLGHAIALMLAGARFKRDQRDYPLSKPAPKVKRDTRIKVAVDINPDDLSAAAQDAVLELSSGDAQRGLRAMASLIAQQDRSAPHLTAIMVRVEDGEFEGVNRLATRIQRARYKAADVQNASPVMTVSEPPKSTTTAALIQEDKQRSPELLAALSNLLDWAERNAARLRDFLVEDGGGQLVFREPIRSPSIRVAYAAAGNHPEFQAQLRRLMSRG